MVDLLAKNNRHIQLLGDARHIPPRQLQGQKLDARNERVSQVGGNDTQETRLLDLGLSESDFEEVAERLNARPKKLKAVRDLHIIGAAALIGDGHVFEENFGDVNMAKEGC